MYSPYKYTAVTDLTCLEVAVGVFLFFETRQVEGRFQIGDDILDGLVFELERGRLEVFSLIFEHRLELFHGHLDLVRNVIRVLQLERLQLEVIFVSGVSPSRHLLISSPESSSLITTSKSSTACISSKASVLSLFSSTRNVEPDSPASMSSFGRVHFSFSDSRSSSCVSPRPTQLDLHLLDLVLRVVFHQELDHRQTPEHVLARPHEVLEVLFGQLLGLAREDALADLAAQLRLEELGHLRVACARAALRVRLLLGLLMLLHDALVLGHFLCQLFRLGFVLGEEVHFLHIERAVGHHVVQSRDHAVQLLHLQNALLGGLGSAGCLTLFEQPDVIRRSLADLLLVPVFLEEHQNIRNVRGQGGLLEADGAERGDGGRPDLGLVETDAVDQEFDVLAWSEYLCWAARS